MPELPDVDLYVEALGRTVLGHAPVKVRVQSPFVLRSVDPSVQSIVGNRVLGVRRMGKRLVFAFEAPPVRMVIHLMIAGRLRWKEPGATLHRKQGLAAFDFEHGSLVFTEASPKKRASITMAHDDAGVRALDPGGLEVFAASEAAFLGALRAENHTLKRALTDPHILSGIGNAYSDEILHRAGLSPLKWTTRLTDEEGARLFEATRSVLREWTERLRLELGGGFPDKVTAFRPEMAVHGKYGQPCPVCGAAVQRIRRADNEVNYCPGCQTEGKLLADRSLSRLLKDDWPDSLEDLEERKERLRRGVDPKPEA
ncbi:MAG: DNA-formamidopyrimidine glycosylase family protein [Polyangiales bacterium]|nr:formamidopyrimidine-DNA glycosylase [Myxococcales bacterium]